MWGDWGSDVIVYNCPPGYYYDLFGNCVPCPEGHYVDAYGRCLPLPGFSGPPASHGGSLPSLTPLPSKPRWQAPQAPLKPVETSGATSSTPPSFPSDAPIARRRGPAIPHGLKGPGVAQALAERAIRNRTATREIAIPPYVPSQHETHMRVMRGVHGGVAGSQLDAGDYHIQGTGVVLREAADASSKVLATLENNEGVYAYGETHLDTAHMMGPGGTVVPNDTSVPGLEYARVKTQTHGEGWVADYFLTPGAGRPLQPATPTPTPATVPAPKTMAQYAPWILGGVAIALGATVIYSVARRMPHRTLRPA